MNCAGYEHQCDSSAVASLGGVPLCGPCLTNYQHVGDHPVYFADPPSPNDAPIPDVDGEPPSTPQTGGDVTTCQHLAACATSSCDACEPRWRGQAGRAMADYLHDEPAEFLTLFAALSERNKEETYAAIASFGGMTVAAVRTFLARSRARATALGMLGTCL